MMYRHYQSLFKARTILRNDCIISLQKVLLDFSNVVQLWKGRNLVEVS